VNFILDANKQGLVKHWGEKIAIASSHYGTSHYGTNIH
jgi:hypothetical protein